MLVLLSLNFGAVFVSRNAAGLTGPYLKNALDLDNTELGALSAGYGLAWAVVGYFGTTLIERRMNTWTALAALAMLDAASLFGTAVATSFWAVMVFRLVAGGAGGPAMPLSAARIARGSSPRNRGQRMGVIQAFGGGLIGAILAPLCLIGLADAWGWRVPFAAAGVICAAAGGLLWFGARALALDVPDTAPSATGTSGTAGVQSRRNVVLCCIVSALMVGWLVVTTTFLPTFLVGTLGWSFSRTALAMSGFGFTSMMSAVVAPLISDRVGRRPALVGCTLVGGITAVGVCLLRSDSPQLLGMVAGVGIAGGAFPIFMAAIPAESAVAGRVAAGIALVQGVGEVLGGVAAPLIAGYAGDQLGARAMVWVATVCVCAAALVSCLVLETNPPRLRL